MKKVFLNAMLVAFIGFTTVSCKNEAKNETKANDAEEVVEATEEAQTFMIDAANSKIDWVGSTEGKEDHFFNVEKHPEATFEITKLTEKDGKNWLSGNLTLKGTSKNVEIPVTYSMNDDQSTLKIESEPFTIDRTDWNVNYGSKSVFDDLKDKFVNDEIEITFMLQAKKA